MPRFLMTGLFLYWQHEKYSLIYAEETVGLESCLKGSIILLKYLAIIIDRRETERDSGGKQNIFKIKIIIVVLHFLYAQNATAKWG